ncbi:uncharacterized protein LOC142767445 isoform X3 [Rhipicephalus microplus]|uniref:uncharacterized protein LOC142767445 isoform X3 n=1 Tax=Rhipicephalus microplus TaxID=6941 RepID=UPI003F6C5DC0
MVQTNVVDPLNYLYSHMTADNAAGIVQTHVVDPMNQAYKHMSHNATDLVHRHVVTSVKQAPAYVQMLVKVENTKAKNIRVDMKEHIKTSTRVKTTREVTPRARSTKQVITKAASKKEVNTRAQSTRARSTRQVTSKAVNAKEKESKELLDTMMKEAMEATGKEEKKKPEHMATEEPHHKKTTGKATGKSVAEWVATPEEKHEYRKFQDMLQSKAMHDHTKGHEDSAVKHHEGPGKQEAPQHPPHGAIAKHHEEAHKPGDNKQGGKEDAHKKLETEAHKPEKDRGLHGDKTGRAKPEAKPGEKPHGVAAAPTAGLTGEPAGQGPVLEGAAAPVAKSSSWWKSLRHFFRRKPEDEESSGEEGFRYREMDEEFIECAGDQGAAGEAAQESHKDGAAVVAADAATGPKQYKLNACLLVSSGAVIFVVLLAVLLSGDLFDDLDNSVPTFEIDLGKVVNVLDDVGFLGAGMNSSIMGKPGSWRPLLERPANDSLVLLLKGLAPAVLRFAGRETDHFYFVEGEKDGNSSRGGTDEGGLASRGNRPFVVQRSQLHTASTNTRERFPLMGSEWIALNHFVERCDWRLLFSLNAHRLEDVEPSSPVFGRWDLRDAALLMRFSERHNLTSKLMWQLGEAVAENWPGPGPSPYALACEYEALRDLVSFYPAPLVGPGVSTLRRAGLRYLERFIKGRGRFVDVVSLRHVLHDAPNVTVKDLLNPAVMERFDSQLQSVQALVETAAPRITRIWLTSLSTTPGYVEGVSGTFASMLAWTEAFGAASKRGIAAVLKDSLLGTTAESMIVVQNEAGEGARPTADYWVSLLLTKHVGQKVLTIDGPKLKDPATRIYVHCARNYPGGLAMYGVRLADTGAKLKKSGSRRQWEQQLRWVLTPASDVGGSEVYLNGEALSWAGEDGTDPPDPKPEELLYTIISLPAWSMGLFVFPNVKAKACYDDWTP